MEKYEAVFISRMARQASLVVTPLHHVATPCMAMGIPVILCRSDADKRFSFLEEIMPVYRPEQYSRIDWSPGPVDLSLHVRTYADRLKAAMDALS